MNSIIFTQKLNNFTEKIAKQRQRGLNDFNPLLVVLKSHDEVRLHSRMIGSFLDIEGEHYQGSLFLESFLETIGVSDFPFDLNACKLKLEYKNIDIYLTDGTSHIIIENKIYAQDQKHQIRRYIDIVKEGNPNVTVDKLLVVYLTLNGHKPSCSSLDTLKIKNNFICNNGEKVAQYYSMSYEKDILTWLKKSQYEIQNINNLNSSFSFYINTIEQLLGKYESPVQKYKDFFLEQNNYRFFNENKIEFLSNDKASITDAWKEAKSILFNRFYKKLLDEFLVKNESLSFNEYRDNSDSNGGNILMLIYEEMYHFRCFIKKNNIVNISIGINEEIDWKNNREQINSKLQNPNIQKYITGKVKGIKLENPISLATPSIDNLFLDNKLEPLEYKKFAEIQQHLDFIRKELGSNL